MKINYRILNISTWLTVLSVLLLPGKVYTEGVSRTEYGLPFRFFTQYHLGHTTGNPWFISDVFIGLGAFIIDVLMIYFFIHVGIYIKNRWGSSRVEQ
ncbi:hypothetical protein J2W91_001918 [Paenibacillus amylolyticus]|uniref:Uncharacterized protein n=1 Tax=Paenibacillus amylolyticus TaxID=1451 RepID=A0AAP5H3Y8_PAEAM|nr:hypothetical protein [Paenibacillus amylolyticus]MDR6723466.1 hypothetical protein [Paenibacillus amylolyticus]